MEFKEWQESAFRRVQNGSANVMIIAENGQGKTTLLSHIKTETGAPLLDGLTVRGDELAAAVDANSLVLLDEAGAFGDYEALVEALEDNPETQVVVATLPDCPSMQMVREYFDIVRAPEPTEE